MTHFSLIRQLILLLHKFQLYLLSRVLLERLIVNRPHPWGLLITFIELIKNPTFKFWSHEFVHCAPEIQKLFESVARSCMVASQPRQEIDQPQQPAPQNAAE